MSSYAYRFLKRDYEPGSFIHHFIKGKKHDLEKCEKIKNKLPGQETTYNVYNEIEEKIHKTNETKANAKWNNI